MQKIHVKISLYMLSDRISSDDGYECLRVHCLMVICFGVVPLMIPL